jgi:hypothetical protein
MRWPSKTGEDDIERGWNMTAAEEDIDDDLPQATTTTVMKRKTSF